MRFMVQKFRSSTALQRLVSAFLLLSISASIFEPMGAFIPYGNSHGEPPEQGQTASADELKAAKAVEDLDRAIEMFDSNSTVEIKQQLQNMSVLALRGQRFELLDDTGNVQRSISFDRGKVINLTSYIPTNFNASVQYGQNEAGEFAIKIFHKGKLRGQYIIPEIKPKNIIHDADFVAVLDTSNELHILDHVFVRNQILRSPLPVVDALKFSTPMQDLSMEWITPTSSLPSLEGDLRQHEKTLFRMKNLVLFSGGEGSGRTLVANIDRDALSMITFTKLSSLALLLPSEGPAEAYLLVEKPQDRKIPIEKVPTLANLAADPKIRENAAQLQNNLESLGLVDPLYAIPSSSLAHLVERGSQSAALRNEIGLPESERARFKFSYEEVIRNHTALVQKQQNDQTARTESPSKIESRMREVRGAVWEKLRSTLRPGMLLKVAAFTTLAGLAFSNSPDDFLFQSRILLYGKLSNFISIFKNPAYADVAILSTLCLSFLVPATNLVGRAINTFGGPLRGVGVKRALGTLGMRIYSLTMPLFIHGLAVALKQPLMTEAMRYGINPFTVIRIGENNPVGKQLAAEGYDSKLLVVGAGTNSTLPARERALQIMANQKHRRLALASAIAFRVAADTYGQDASLVAALSNLNLSEIKEEKLKELIQSKEFRMKWLYIGQELSSELVSLKKSDSIGDLASLSDVELGALFEKAKQTCIKLNGMTSLGKFFAQSRIAFKIFYQSQLKTFANYGLDAVKFLRNGHPSNFVTNLFYTQFTADVALSVWQIPFVGARANLGVPDQLAANPNGFLWTNSKHVGDMFDQVRIYNINAPSSYALAYDYNGIQNAREPQHNMDQLLVEGLERQEGPFSTLGRWTKNALNLRKQNYGFFFWKNFQRRLFSIQSYFLWAVSIRYMSTDMGLGHSFLASTWAFFMANWYFGLLWDFANNGQQASLAEIEARTAEFTEKKANLLRALREGTSSAEIIKHTADLVDSYAKNSLPKAALTELDFLRNQTSELRLRIAEAEEQPAAAKVRLKIENAMADVQEIVFADYEKIDERQRAIIQQTKVNALESVIESAKSELREGSDLGSKIHLNALSLLQYSLKNPRYGNAYNSTMNKGITFFFAFSTTLLGTYLMAHSQVEQPWLTKTAMGIAEGMGLYAITYHGQKAFNYAWDKTKEALPKLAPLIKGAVNARLAEAGCRKYLD